MPRTAKMGNSRIIELPSARLVSTKMTKMDPEDAESRQGQDTFHTVMVMQMGQFIDHDITHSPIFQFDDNPFFEETCCDGTSFPGTFCILIVEYHSYNVTLLNILFAYLR